MMLTGALPVWFVASALARDVVIFTGGVYVNRRTGVVLMSNMFGKYTVAVIGLAIVTALFGFGGSLRWVQPGLEILAACMMAISLGLYAQRLVAALHSQHTA